MALSSRECIPHSSPSPTGLSSLSSLSSLLHQYVSPMNSLPPSHSQPQRCSPTSQPLPLHRFLQTHSASPEIAYSPNLSNFSFSPLNSPRGTSASPLSLTHTSSNDSISPLQSRIPLLAVSKLQSEPPPILRERRPPLFFGTNPKIEKFKVTPSEPSPSRSGPSKTPSEIASYLPAYSNLSRSQTPPQGKLVQRTKTLPLHLPLPSEAKRNRQDLLFKRFSQTVDPFSLGLIEPLSEQQVLDMTEIVDDSLNKQNPDKPLWYLFSSLFGTEVKHNEDFSSPPNDLSQITTFTDVLLCDKQEGKSGIKVAVEMDSDRLKIHGRNGETMWSIPLNRIEYFAIYPETASMGVRFCPLQMRAYHTLYLKSSLVVKIYNHLIYYINASTLKKANTKQLISPRTPR
jgi:hypothetical protein